MTMDPLHLLVNDYKHNTELTYQTWFLYNEDRLKASRTIRRGVQEVSFPTAAEKKLNFN